MGLFNRKKKTMSLNEAAEKDMVMTHSIKNLDRVMNNKQIAPRAEIPVVMADAYEDSIEKENKINDEMNKVHKNVRQFISDYDYKEIPDKVNVTGAMRKMKLSENLFEDISRNERNMIYKKLSPAKDDFLTLFEKLVDSAISCDDNNLTDCVYRAIDDGLMHNDDIWKVKEHYENAELTEESFRALYEDLYAIVVTIKEIEANKLKKNNRKLTEDYSDLQQIADLIRYNGARYWGAEIPRAISDCINQANIEDNTRLKELNATVINNNTIKVDYITQESFEDEDAYILAGEIERAITAICDKLDYVEPFNVDIIITARDGKKYGYFNDIVEINNGPYTYYNSEVNESLTESRPTGWRKPIFDDLYDEIYVQLANSTGTSESYWHHGVYDDSADTPELGLEMRDGPDGENGIHIELSDKSKFDFAKNLAQKYNLKYTEPKLEPGKKTWFMTIWVPDTKAKNAPVVWRGEIKSSDEVAKLRAEKNL